MGGICKHLPLCRVSPVLLYGCLVSPGPCHVLAPANPFNSDYASRVFGFETFGVVYGSIICLSGLFNFAQSGLDALTHGRFNNDPKPVNIFLLVSAFVVGVALVGYVWSKSRSIERAELEAEAEDADENVALMPGHDERVHEDHHPVDVHAEEGRGT